MIQNQIASIKVVCTLLKDILTRITLDGCASCLETWLVVVDVGFSLLFGINCTVELSSNFSETE